MSTAVNTIGTTKIKLLTLLQYWPLITGLLLACLSTYGLMSIGSVHDVRRTMSLFMGSYFVLFSVPKFINLPAFVEIFSRYDLISNRYPSYGFMFPVVELSAGLTLLSGVQLHEIIVSFALNLLIAAVSALSIMSVYRSLQLGRQLDCACAGSIFSFPLSKVVIAESSLMLVMSVSMLIMMGPGHMGTMAIMGLGVLFV